MERTDESSATADLTSTSDDATSSGVPILPPMRFTSNGRAMSDEGERKEPPQHSDQPYLPPPMLPVSPPLTAAQNHFHAGEDDLVRTPNRRDSSITSGASSASAAAAAASSSPAAAAAPFSPPSHSNGDHGGDQDMDDDDDASDVSILGERHSKIRVKREPEDNHPSTAVQQAARAERNEARRMQRQAGPVIRRHWKEAQHPAVALALSKERFATEAARLVEEEMAMEGALEKMARMRPPDRMGARPAAAAAASASSASAAASSSAAAAAAAPATRKARPSRQVVEETDPWVPTEFELDPPALFGRDEATGIRAWKLDWDPITQREQLFYEYVYDCEPRWGQEPLERNDLDEPQGMAQWGYVENPPGRWAHHIAALDERLAARGEPPCLHIEDFFSVEFSDAGGGESGVAAVRKALEENGRTTPIGARNKAKAPAKRKKPCATESPRKPQPFSANRAAKAILGAAAAAAASCIPAAGTMNLVVAPMMHEDAFAVAPAAAAAAAEESETESEDDEPAGPVARPARPDAASSSSAADASSSTAASASADVAVKTLVADRARRVSIPSDKALENIAALPASSPSVLAGSARNATGRLLPLKRAPGLTDEQWQAQLKERRAATKKASRLKQAAKAKQGDGKQRAETKESTAQAPDSDEEMENVSGDEGDGSEPDVSAAVAAAAGSASPRQSRPTRELAPAAAASSRRRADSVSPARPAAKSAAKSSAASPRKRGGGKQQDATQAHPWHAFPAISFLSASALSLRRGAAGDLDESEHAATIRRRMDFFSEAPRRHLTLQQREFVSGMFPGIGEIESTALPPLLPPMDTSMPPLPPPMLRAQSSRSAGAGASGAARPSRGATFDPANVLVKTEPGLEHPDSSAAGGDDAAEGIRSDEEEDEEEDNADAREGGFGRGGGSSSCNKRRRLAASGPSARAQAHHTSLAAFYDSAPPSMSVQQWDSRLRMLDRFIAQGIQLPQCVVEHLIERMLDSPEAVDYDASQTILAGLCRVLAVQPQALICTSAHVHLLCTLTKFVDATFNELLDHEVLPPAAARQAAEAHVRASLPATPSLHDRLSSAHRIAALLNADTAARTRAITMLRKYLLVHRLLLTVFVEDARMTEVWNEMSAEEVNNSGMDAAAAFSSAASAPASSFFSREVASLSSKAPRRTARGGSSGSRGGAQTHDDSCALYSCFQRNAYDTEKLFDWRLVLKNLSERLQTYLSEFAETNRIAESTAVPSELVSEWLMYVRGGWLELIAQMDNARLH